MINKCKQKYILVGLLGLSLMISGCTDSTSNEDDGTLSVLITDAPFPSDLVAEAIIIIDSLDIRAKADGAGDGPFTTLSQERGTYDLMDLRNGVTASLVNLDVPAGTYDLVRLFVDSAYVVLNDGQTYALRVPSGNNTGLKVFIRPQIEVIDGITSELLIDMDVSKSFLVQRIGQSSTTELRFTFKPVIRAVNLSTAGSLTGLVTDTSAVPVPIADAQIEVADGDSTLSSTFTDVTGGYTMIGIPAGFYKVTAYAAEYDSLVVTDVEIKAATATEQDMILHLLPGVE
ncbi:DUF4382 domain-containing protein [Candidatus Neomarinimicrobiota bacterium]